MLLSWSAGFKLQSNNSTFISRKQEAICSWLSCNLWKLVIEVLNVFDEVGTATSSLRTRCSLQFPVNMFVSVISFSSEQLKTFLIWLLKCANLAFEFSWSLGGISCYNSISKPHNAHCWIEKYKKQNTGIDKGTQRCVFIKNHCKNQRYMIRKITAFSSMFFLNLSVAYHLAWLEILYVYIYIRCSSDRLHSTIMR